MIMFRRVILLTLLILTCFGGSALAVDYNFPARNYDDFYHSTLYEDVYGSAYNYGGPNVIDFTDTTALLPGIITPTVPLATPASGIVPPEPVDTAFYPSNGSHTNTNSYADTGSDFVVTTTSFTAVGELERSDGSIGTLAIPSLDISMKVYEGATTQSMNKGLGHFSDTSAWEGNVCLAGHNRGAKYTIGSIKNLDKGDIIRYSTVLGTREYSVTFVSTISNNDWSYLANTSDNRITLITCLADQPELRICVQAKEIK